MNIKPADRVEVLIGCADDAARAALSANEAQIARLARASQVVISDKLAAPQASARAVTSDAEIAVPLEGLIDFAQERARLTKEQDKLGAELSKLNAQLGNPNFVSRAPADKVAELRERVTDINQRMCALGQNLAALA
jgi:valyl-tRNA synthetase